MLVALILLALPPALFVASGVSDGLGRQAMAARLRRIGWASFAGIPLAFIVSFSAIDHIYRALACEQMVLSADSNAEMDVEISAWSETCRRGEAPTYHVAVRFGGMLLGQWEEVVTAYIDPVPVLVKVNPPTGTDLVKFAIGLASEPGATPSRFVEVSYDRKVGHPLEVFFYRRGFRVEAL